MANQNNKIEDKKNKNRDKNSALKLSDMIVPVVTVIMFLILLIFVYLPQFTTAIEYNDKIKSLKAEEKQLQKNVLQANKLDENNNTVIQDLNLAETVVSKKLAVSDFSFDIIKLAEDKGLTLQSLSSSDIGYASNESFMFMTGTVKGITGPIRFEGTFDDIVEFLEEIKLGSPYLIDISETSLRKFPEVKDRWSLDLSITGYYMIDAEKVTINPLDPIKLYTNYETELQDIIVRSRLIEK